MACLQLLRKEINWIENLFERPFSNLFYTLCHNFIQCFKIPFGLLYFPGWPWGCSSRCCQRFWWRGCQKVLHLLPVGVLRTLLPGEFRSVNFVIPEARTHINTQNYVPRFQLSHLQDLSTHKFTPFYCLFSKIKISCMPHLCYGKILNGLLVFFSVQWCVHFVCGLDSLPRRQSLQLSSIECVACVDIWEL